MQKKIKNPILLGFNPDPCILRVEDTYYIAVSSFEWLPGVRVYESTDLVNWDYCTDILTNQVHLQGNPINCSIWAPQLSYSDGEFHLLYTDVKSSQRPFKDCHNYLISSSSIKGPWSEPIYLNSSGFDPSLFHDKDGRKWISNSLWDYRIDTPNKSSGIVIQEYSPTEKRLIGEPKKIFDCTDLGKTEAPHLYQKDGFYYLMLAEGGTGSGHSVTMARSKNVLGPYEVDPHYPMMTSSQNPEAGLQCAGHASLLETPEGEWYIVHLATRPLKGQFAILGRETALQKVYWDEQGWLRLDHKGTVPAMEVPVPKGFIGEIKNKQTDFHDDFNSATLKSNWNSLRMMVDEQWCSLKDRKGYLRLYGGESPHSLFRHHLIGIRQTDFHFRAETAIEFTPTNFLQMAGLLLFLNPENYIYAYITFEENSRVLRVMNCKNGTHSLTDVKIDIPVEKGLPIQLAVNVNYEKSEFYYRFSNQEQWKLVHEEKDITFLSGGFTGNFIGIACHDMNQYKGCHADFEYFCYEGKDY